MTSTLAQLARDHCRASKPPMSIEGFIPTAYGVGRRFFCEVAAGKKKPSQKLLLSMSQMQVRLFPSEPARVVQIPNFPPVLIGHLN